MNVTATPRIEGQNPIEPLKIYELDFILTGLLVMITLQPPPKKKTYQPVFQKMGQGYSSRYNDHGQHGLDKVFVVGQENSFCCPKTCCQVAIIYPRGSRGSSSWVKPTTFRESKLLGCCGYLGLTPKEWIQIAVFVFFGYDSSID